MKHLIIILLMFTGFVNAQLNIDARVGQNYYWDEGSISNFNDDVAFGFSYELAEVVRPRLLFNIGKLKSDSHNYETNYYGVDLDILVNLKSAFGRTHEIWKIYPYVGLGQSVYEDQNVTTMNAGIVNEFKIDDYFYLGFEAGAKGLYSLEHPVGCEDYPTRLTGANGFNWFAGITASIKLWKNKPKIIHTETDITPRLPPVINYNTNCNECKEVEPEPEPEVYFFKFFFSEGEWKFDENSKDDAREFDRLTGTMKKYPKWYLTIDGYACGGHGGDNIPLTQRRADEIAKALGKEFEEDFEGTGKGVDYTHRHNKLNRFVLVTVSKNKL